MTDPKEKYLEIIRDWRSHWMHHEEGYFQRAWGIDSNMIHHLARRLGNAEDSHELIEKTESFLSAATENGRLRQAICDASADMAAAEAMANNCLCDDAFRDIRRTLNDVLIELNKKKFYYDQKV